MEKYCKLCLYFRSENKCELNPALFIKPDTEACKDFVLKDKPLLRDIITNLRNKISEINEQIAIREFELKKLESLKSECLEKINFLKDVLEDWELIGESPRKIHLERALNYLKLVENKLAKLSRNNPYQEACEEYVSKRVMLKLEK